MKKTMIINFIFMSFISFNSLANEDPSLEHTMDFIVKKFEESVCHYDHTNTNQRVGFVYHKELQDVTFDYKSKVLSYTVVSGGRDLKRSPFKIDFSLAYPRVNTFIESGVTAGCIRLQVFTPNDYHRIYINNIDNIPERLVKALNHAIILSGGKNEAF
ncbi:hypothetical protein CXF85_10205 [Colwellia sp. 75C3]|uniref:hypothetical protein n=1 Tax=Colwellia sp. 75C3 TaxID=888425 RepID=UPI000C349248|nr:hypothetical protein [Colwellia sp. 75C3]PKG83861.1 hypothetical protein CXF85_10205 [Colwellia sp. 75C3]